MVRGLQQFSQHFVGLEDCFILIGGTACELWMGSQGLAFRATKDLDIVLVVEALKPEFFERFWTFIQDAVGGNNLPAPDEIIQQLIEIFGLSFEDSGERTQQ